MVYEYRNIMTFVNIFAHKDILRRKRRGIQPEEIQAVNNRLDPGFHRGDNKRAIFFTPSPLKGEGFFSILFYFPSPLAGEGKVRGSGFREISPVPFLLPRSQVGK